MDKVVNLNDKRSELNPDLGLCCSNCDSNNVTFYTTYEVFIKAGGKLTKNNQVDGICIECRDCTHYDIIQIATNAELERRRQIYDSNSVPDEFKDKEPKVNKRVEVHQDEHGVAIKVKLLEHLVDGFYKEVDDYEVVCEDANQE